MQPIKSQSFIVREKYDPRLEIAPDVWCVAGDFENMAFRRRMTIVRVSTGSLVLHSPIYLHDADLQEIDRLGKVDFIVRPSNFHGDESVPYAERYPSARVFAPAAQLEKLRRMGARVDGSLESDWPAELSRELICFPLHGTRHHESVFYHPSSRTLITTDLVFNLAASDFRNPIERALMRFNQVVDRLGPSRLFRWGFTSDALALARSLKPVLDLPIDHLVMSHGSIVNGSDTTGRLRAAFAYLPRVN